MSTTCPDGPPSQRAGTLRLPRSYLWLAGDRADALAAGRASMADRLVIDLAGVAPQHKGRARDAVAAVLDAAQPVVLRIDAGSSAWFDDDVALCRHPGVAAVILPRTEGIDAVCAVAEQCLCDVLPGIATARGVVHARAIATVPGVTRLVFDAAALALDLGLDAEPPHPSDPAAAGHGEDATRASFEAAEPILQTYRAQLLLASRCAALAAPVETIGEGIADPAALRAIVGRARRSGFRAGLCRHGWQVVELNSAFSSSAPGAPSLDSSFPAT